MRGRIWPHAGIGGARDISLFSVTETFTSDIWYLIYATQTQQIADTYDENLARKPFWKI
jgi:hypothetical protein